MKDKDLMSFKEKKKKKVYLYVTLKQSVPNIMYL